VAEAYPVLLQVSRGRNWLLKVAVMACSIVIEAKEGACAFHMARECGSGVKKSRAMCPAGQQRAVFGAEDDLQPVVRWPGVVHGESGLTLVCFPGNQNLRDGPRCRGG
jgi:hypothetical protein